MVALSVNGKPAEAVVPRKQESDPAIAPAIDRAKIFEQVRAASSTGFPAELSSSLSAPTPASVSRERALEVENRAQELYRAMHGGLTGWGTDETQLLSALKGLSPPEVQFLKDTYANRFNTKLEDDIASELSGDDLFQARAALRGDRASEAATALHRAMDGVGTDEDSIIGVLSSLKGAEQVEVAQAYKKAFDVDLDTALAQELGGDDLTQVRAIRMGQPVTAAAAELHKAIDGVGTDEASIQAVLKRHSPDQLQAIAAEYQRLYGATLTSDLQSEFSGHELSEVLALARGDRTAAKVSQLRGALEGAGSSTETIFSVLEGALSKERAHLRASFKSQTGTSLEDALSGDLSGTDLEKANILLAHGKLSDVEKLRFAFDGAGTDEATIKEVLRNRSKGEIDYLKKEYEARYHESLESRIHDELGGSDEFRALQALKGRPATVEEALKNMQELDAFERSGILSNVIGAFSKEDERITEQLAVATFDIAAAQKDGVISPEERASIERTLRFAEGNIDLYAERRDAIADTGATVAAVAGSTAVVVGTGGLATPGVIAMAAAAGGASYAGTKYAVQGKGYDGENLASDVGIGAVEGAVTALTAGGAAAVKNAAQQGAKQALSTGSQAAMRETAVESVGSTVQDAMRPDTWAGGAAAGVANLAVSAAGTAITSGALHRVGEVRPPAMRVHGASPELNAPHVELSSAPALHDKVTLGAGHTPKATEPTHVGHVALNPAGKAPLVPIEHFRFTSQNPSEWALGVATSPAYRVANLPPELREVRLGIPGRVRTAAELSDAQVAQVLNAQLNHVTEKQVQELVSAFGPERKGIATDVLERLSRSANLDVMSDVTDALRKSEYQGRQLYSPRNGSLVDSLKYLANNKKVLRSTITQDVTDTDSVTPNSIVLLDRDMLQRLKTDSKFVKQLVANKVTLVHPTGFIDGITPFNSSTIGDIKDKVSGVMTRVESLQRVLPNASTDELVSKSLEAGVLAELKAIDSRLAKQLDFIAPSPSSRTGISGIVDSLNGSGGISAEEVTQVLSKLDAPWRPLAREAVTQLSEVQSHRTMAALAREQFEKVRAFAHAEGVAIEDVMFAVRAGDTKSYGIATYIFKEANAGKLRPDQFVSMDTLATAAKEKAGRKTLVVALDDFSGSGSSLLSLSFVRGDIRNAVGPSVPIVCAPFVANTNAFNMLAEVRKTDPHTTMIPGRIVASLLESDLCTVDGGALKEGLKQVVGKAQYGHAFSFVSMPYMGPDNNCALFGAEFFNPYFIFNGSKAVCKTDFHVNTTDMLPLEGIVRREVSFVRLELANVAELSPHEGLKMVRRIEELTEAAHKLNILNDAQGEIQAAVNDVALKCRGEVLRATEAVRRVGRTNAPEQLLLDFEAAQQLSRRLSLDQVEEDDAIKVVSAHMAGGVA